MYTMLCVSLLAAGISLVGGIVSEVHPRRKIRRASRDIAGAALIVVLPAAAIAVLIAANS